MKPRNLVLVLGLEATLVSCWVSVFCSWEVACHLVASGADFPGRLPNFMVRCEGGRLSPGFPFRIHPYIPSRMFYPMVQA